MLEAFQFDPPPKVFHGVRFVLLGFDSINKSPVYSKLVEGGGVDVGQYGPFCTHVIVDKLTYDDPICVTARNDGKILVNGLWVVHSFDVGTPADSTNIMYRPLRDLKGIPGAKYLHICLTGYQRQDREDIMTMTSLMGANFSKPLVANKVTHLIGYKFEGDKYELAKRTNKIKLVNHLWLEDCLKTWEILPEADYNKSGYELELLEAEAKDSEEETDVPSKQNQLLNPKLEFKVDQLDSSSSRGLSNVIITHDIDKSHEDPNFRESHMKQSEVLDSSGAEALRDASSGKLVKSCDRTTAPATVGNDLASTSGNIRCVDSEASKSSFKSYNSKTPERTTLSMYSRGITGKLSTAQMVNAAKFNESGVDTKTEHLKGVADIGCFRTPKEPVLPLEEKFRKINENRVSEAQKAEHVSGACASEGSLEMSKREPLKPASSIDDPTATNDCSALAASFDSPQRTSEKIPKLASSAGRKSQACSTPVSKTLDGDSAGAFQTSPVGSKKTTFTGNSEHEDVIKRQESATCETFKISHPRSNTSETKKPNFSSNLSLPDAHSKQPTKKFGRKSWSKGSASNLKGSIYLNKSVPEDDPTISLNVEEKSTGHEKFEMVPPSVNLNTDLELAAPGGLQSENKLQQHSMSMDDETEAPEDKEENEPREAIIEPKNRETESDIKWGNDKSEFLHRCTPISHNEPCGEEEDLAKQKEATCDKSNLGDLATSHNETCTEEKDGAKQESPCIKRKSDDTAASHNKTSAEEKDGAKQKESTCGKRKSDEPSHMKKAVKENTSRRKKSKIYKTTNASSLSKDNEGKEFLKAVGEENSREVEPGIVGNTGEDKSEAQHKSKSNTGGLHSHTASGDNKPRAKPKKTGKRKLVESSHLDNSVKDNINAVNRHPLTKVNKRMVNSVSKTVNSEASTDKAEKEQNEDSTPQLTGDLKRTESINKLNKSVEGEKENMPVHTVDQSASDGNNIEILAFDKALHKLDTSRCKSNLKKLEVQRAEKNEPVMFILSGHKLQRKEFQQVIRQLKGKVCRDSHQWSYQATHFIVPDPIRRTEKFFAAAASGRWILKTDYLSDSSRAGNFLAEEPYEWHKSGLSEDGAINLEAPRKWRLQRERTGHGAFYGMNIIIYGECIAPSLDTLKRVLKAGEGTILATSPPYNRFLGSMVDFAVVSPGMPRVDMWVQEFLRHEIPCVAADYLVEFVCRPGYSLERHVLYNTHAWAEKAFKNVVDRSEASAELTSPLRDGGDSASACHEVATPANDIDNDLPCQVCGSRDRGEEMLICGNESGSTGCGIGTHIDCCDPPLPDVPIGDWFCPNCSDGKSSKKPLKNAKKKKLASKRR